MEKLCFSCNSIDELNKDIVMHDDKRCCKLCNNISNFYNVIIHKYTCSVYNLKHKAHKYKTKYLCKSCKYFIGSNIDKLMNISESINIQP